jgi:AP2 domain/HNH endonuclease
MIALYNAAMKKIILSDGSEALVSDRDFERVRPFSWHPHSRGYAQAWINGRKVLLHRFIKRAEPGRNVDHRNTNKRDCQRRNLRWANKSQNGRNSKVRKGRQFKGVSFCKRAGRVARWVAYATRPPGKYVFIGWFMTEEQAARAYDEYAKKHYGRFARLNFEQESA